MCSKVLACSRVPHCLKILFASSMFPCPLSGEILYYESIPTDKDIETLNSRIGAKLPNIKSVPVVIRRHTLRQAINMRCLQELESSSNVRIVYCVADISNLKNSTNIDRVHQVQFGERRSPIDAILPLLPGVPLMVTKNIDRPLGKHRDPCSFRY
jgi:hypothetical protein